jgi:hypothetical protein
VAPDDGLGAMRALDKTKNGLAEPIENGWHLDVVSTEATKILDQSFMRKHGWIKRRCTQLLS